MRSSRMPERSGGGISNNPEDVKTMLRLLGSGHMGWSKERMSFWCGLVCYRFNHNDRGDTESDSVLRGSGVALGRRFRCLVVVAERGVGGDRVKRQDGQVLAC